MPINLALNTALSGLLTSQQALDVISNNLANINNPNYTRKTLNQEEVVLQGTGAGVQVSQITREVNQGLNTALNNATGSLNQLQTTQQYYTQLQNLFGAPGDGSSISDEIQSLNNAFTTLSNSSNQTPSATVQAAQVVANTLQTMSTSIQGYRVQADQQIGQDISQVNTTLQNIANLNNQIAVDSVSGIDVSELEDQRDGELTTLSGYMNYTTYTSSNNTVAIFTPQGTPLLSNTAQTLDHSSVSALEPTMSYAGGQIQGITVNGVDITSQITSGEIASLVQMRDQTLPNLQTQLDTLAQTLQTGLNQINNAGVSYPDGGQTFTGTTSFSDPSQQTISLSGGDTAIVLLNADGSQKATTTLSLAMEQYLQANNLPTTNSWSITQVAAGMNSWLNTQYGTTNVTYAQVNPSGNFSINLPQTSGTTIAFRDERTTTFQSSLSSDGTTALGLSGTLTFRDSGGNVYSVPVTAGNTMTDIVNSLNATGGLTASLVPNSDGTGSQLQVVDNAGYDMYIDPDAPGTNVQTQLGLLPAGSNDATNVGINYNSDQLGTSITSGEYASGSTVPGVSGQVTFRDSSGVVAQVNLTASMTLTQIANAIQAASGNKLTAAISSVGNMVALNVVDVAGNQMSVSGVLPLNTAPYQSTPATGTFSAAANGTLTIASGTTNLGTVAISAGDSLATIAAAMNANKNLQADGVQAQVDTDGTNSWLDVVTAAGQPLTFSGANVGTAVGQLNMTLTPGANAPTALGLSPPADQTVSGFSDFLGLNDLLVTGQPVTTFESQTLTTSYMTGSQSNLDFSDASWGNGDPLTGQAESLNLNFKPGMTLQAIAAQINAQAVTYDGSHNPIGTFSSKGGTITIINQPVTLGTVNIAGGETLAQVAEAINSNSTLSAAGVQAIVATDGTNEWLRVYDQQGKALSMAGTMVGTAAGEISFGVNQVANATVVGDGSGARLQITHGSDSDMQVTGTMTNLLNIGAAATGTAESLEVRSDIQANPSLISRGMVQYDPTSNQFFVAAADNSSVEAMANFMNSSLTMPSAGGLGQGQYTLEQYSAALIAANSTNASNNNTQLTYQQTLVSNLTSQKGAVSGVNLDEELSNLIVYQQSYAASAKVIATMQQLLDVLNSIVQ